MKLHEWEIVNDCEDILLYRMRVPSGWLYQEEADSDNRPTLTFVPDPPFSVYDIPSLRHSNATMPQQQQNWQIYPGQVGVTGPQTSGANHL